MYSEIKISKPEDIHDLFKSIRMEMDFFKQLCFEAFLHSFRILEANHHLGKILKSKSNLLTERFFQDRMKYMIYWIYTECPSGGKFISTEESHIEKTLPVIDLAHNYSIIHDFTVAVQKNWAVINVDNKNKTICFKYKDLAKSYIFYKKNENRQNKQNVIINELITENQSNREIKETYSQLIDLTNITQDNRLRYHTNKFILDKMEGFSRLCLEKEYILNDNWSIGPYSVKDFREVWVQLTKLSLIHTLAFNIGLIKNKKHRYGTYNESICRFNKNALIKYIQKYSYLGKAVIEEVIRDLTYDFSIKFIDIIQQPLIEIKENDIFFSPFLIIGSFVDRNLQVLLTKLPYRQQEYSKLKNLKESKMIEDISLFLTNNGFEYQSRIELKENNRKIGDIDILIWDKSYKNYIITELKWFYGPDSTQEMYNHDKWFEEAITKTKEYIKYLNKNIDKITLLNKIPNVKNKKNIYGVIVSKLSTPTAYITDPNFPVIEEQNFVDLIKISDGNIQNLYEKIISFIKKSKEIPKIEETSFEIKVKDFKFILPATILEHIF